MKRFERPTIDQADQSGILYYYASMRSKVAKRNLIVWGWVAAVCFCVASFLTGYVVFARSESSAKTALLYAISFDSSDALRYEEIAHPDTALRIKSIIASGFRKSDDPAFEARAEHDASRFFSDRTQVSYHEMHGKQFIEFSAISGVSTRFFIDNLVGKTACKTDNPYFGFEWSVVPFGSERGGSSSDPYDNAPKMTKGWIVTYTAMDFSWANCVTRYSEMCNLRGHLLEYANYTCEGKWPISWTSFSRRAIGVENVGFRGLPESMYSGRDVSGREWTPQFLGSPFWFLIDGSRSIQFTGGEGLPRTVTSPELARNVQLANPVVVSWELEGLAGLRDAILVLIGCFIALGAGFAVEAGRPIVDRFIFDQDRGPRALPQRTDTTEPTVRWDDPP